MPHRSFPNGDAWVDKKIYEALKEMER